MPPARDKKFLHAILLTGAEYDSILKIRQAFPSYEKAWRASFSALAAAGLSSECAEAITSAREKTKPDEEMRKLVNQGIALVAGEDGDFPEELRNIAAPPLALYIKGRLDSKKTRLAVVGTRKATPYGREAARKIIRDLAERAEVAIVSGLAQGIDAEAHRAAVENNLVTMGVLGGGMDSASFYPPENWRLAEEIATKGGAVISEYPPGAPALKHHFIARNRIIAGLSAGTLVILLKPPKNPAH
ncbi:MAG: DNA-protecting protein DprA [Candidatus Sungbacteria bacterium]|nr:DNA-protecting protein DprA [Candidatus Sungbacteria bacterium]